MICKMDSPFEYPTSVVEADTAVVFCLDSDLRITYSNPAWERFAIENGGPELCDSALVGKCVLEYISGRARDFYAQAYRRVLESYKPWEHRYECSSKDVHREFRLLVVPLKKRPGLLVRNVLQAEHPHQVASCKPLEELYRQSNGLIPMCSGCRRTRRNLLGAEIWDWVPEFLALPQVDARHITYGICRPCRELYYPEYGDSNEAVRRQHRSRRS